MGYAPIGYSQVLSPVYGPYANGGAYAGNQVHVSVNPNPGSGFQGSGIMSSGLPFVRAEDQNSRFGGLIKYVLHRHRIVQEISANNPVISELKGKVAVLEKKVQDDEKAIQDDREKSEKEKLVVAEAKAKKEAELHEAKEAEEKAKQDRLRLAQEEKYKKEEEEAEQSKRKEAAAAEKFVKALNDEKEKRIQKLRSIAKKAKFDAKLIIEKFDEAVAKLKNMEEEIFKDELDNSEEGHLPDQVKKRIKEQYDKSFKELNEAIEKHEVDSVVESTNQFATKRHFKGEKDAGAVLHPAQFVPESEAIGEQPEYGKEEEEDESDEDSADT